MKLDELYSWTAAACLFTFGPAIAALVAGYRGAPFRTRTGDASRGVMLLWFRNEKYRRVADIDPRVNP